MPPNRWLRMSRIGVHPDPDPDLNARPWYFLHKGGPSIFQRKILIHILAGNEYTMVRPRAIRSKNIIVFMRYQLMVVHYHLDDTCKVIHRNDGPAVISYDINGSIIEEKWYHRGILHNTKGPAIIGYNVHQLTHIHYYMNGYPHNMRGPARTYFDCNGKERCHSYWNYGKRLDRLYHP